MKEHTLWVEKYRSKLLNDYLGNEEIKSQISKFIKEQNIPHLLLYGTPGTGKTTLAKLLVNNIDCDFIYINASDERGMDVMRDKVKGFAGTASFKPLKVVILDESDFMREDSQALLRNVIETYSLTTRFILTCNYIERIIDPLQSRCQLLKIVPPSKSEVAKHISEILDLEQIKYELKDLATVVNSNYPDIRKILNKCQLSIHNKALLINNKTLDYNQYMNDILEELKKPTLNSLKKIRQFIADNNITDFEAIYRFLYDHVEDYSKGKDGEVIIVLEEYLYHSNFRIDKEINFSAFISKVLTIITKKQII